MAKEFYNTLGVNEQANQDDIKKAFRTKAKEHHPDKGGDPEVFKKINEAYKTLSDTNERAIYDRGAQNPFTAGGPRGGNPYAAPDMGDIFDQFFNGAQQQQNGVRKGQSVRITVQVTLEDILDGVNKTIKLKRNKKCNTCQGSGGTNPRTCINCGGTGVKVKTTRTIFGNQSVTSACTNCQGAGETVMNRCNGCGGNGHKNGEDKIDILIPPGVYNGLSFIQGGKGHFIRNGEPGDLEIIIQEIPHKSFIRDGHNLHMAKEISVIDAMLGAEMNIATLDKTFSIKIEKGVQSGKVFKMSGKGLPSLQNNSLRGDLYINLSIKIPTKLSDSEVDILKGLKDSRNFRV